MSEPVTVRCTILEERAIALLIEQGNLRVWVPRTGCIQISKQDGRMASTILMPEWLAEAKELNALA
jgi:hypothetical protein